MYLGNTKRRVFVSYSHLDETEVNQFLYQFTELSHVFTPYVLGVGDRDDFINSTDPAYVMSRIRAKYLQDTTVTILLVGSCTHSRRYVDWELKTTLRRGTFTPNGLIGIILPSCGNSARLPPRFEANWMKGHANCYARYWVYPSTPQQLAGWIEDAYTARTVRADLISNSASMMKYNARCQACGYTH